MRVQPSLPDRFFISWKHNVLFSIYCMLSLAFTGSSFSISNENGLFETDLSGPLLFLLNALTALKGTHFYSCICSPRIKRALLSKVLRSSDFWF